MFRVNGKIVRFFDLPEEKRTEFLQKCHRKTMIQCLCRDTHDPNPPLLIVKCRENKYFLANHPDNKDNDHEFTCPYALTGYKKVIKEAGIQIDEQGNIDAKIEIPRERKQYKKETIGDREKGKDSKETSGVTRKREKSALITLFYTILNKNKVEEYVPFQTRNISGRIYAATVNSRVNKHQLTNNFCVVTETHKPKRKDLLVIAWGNEITHPPKLVQGKEFLVKIPIFSVNPSEQTQVSTLTVLKKVYENIHRLDTAVGTGYWVLWRQEGKDKKLRDQVLAFIPAEEGTRIPVESSHEARMIQYLVAKKRHFTKPLFFDETLEARPDIILLDTKPRTIIEVAGLDNDEYNARLKKKQGLYKSKGCQYLKWDTLESLEVVFKNI